MKHIRPCVFALLFASIPPLAAAQKPNILLIMADDMGYSDIGCYGGEIRTPNLDALAKGGLRFSQFYNAARCCPTRASLLTGLYPHQAGMGGMVNGKAPGPYQGYLNDKCVTIAEALRPAGYATYMPGKWELYDLKADRTELNDLSSKHPERVKKMGDKYRVWAKRVGVK